MNAFSTFDLNFRFRNKIILKSINLRVPKGSVFGYIGRNGAGKSTTIKILLGLLSVPDRTVFYENCDLNAYRVQIMQKVGALVESPVLYDVFTCYEQFKYVDYLYNMGEQCIRDVLEMIGLQGACATKTKKLSMGMQQRMGIGLAFFHNPEILLLDEPTNHLDPYGVMDVRQWINHWHEEGKTIFISSHILAEMEKICTHVGIIEEGNLLYQGTMSDLLMQTESNDLEKAYMKTIQTYHETNSIQ